MLKLICSAVFSLTLAVFSAAAARSTEHYDVVVVSGSSGGFGAALAAGRMGVEVALIEDTPVLGGMLSNGISNIDTFSYESLSGIFEEFRARVKEYYAPVMATDPIFASKQAPATHIDRRSQQSNHAANGGRWEPHVADQIFKKMIAATPNVHVFYNCHATGVVMRGPRITGVVTVDRQGGKKTFTAPVVIDATHEGDIAAWAGAPYSVGREARSPREPHAGDILFFNRSGEIMEGSTGREDKAIVSCGLRLNIKNYADNSHILATPPPGYDPKEYLASAYSGGPSMPNGKSEMNVNPVGNEMQEVNWKWPEATRAERARLYEIYKNHALGFLYYLQHERHYTHLGLPDDEFTDNGNIPYRVFVREARRIEGEVKMTESDINSLLTGGGLIPPLRGDSIAIGHYPMDSKPVRRKTDITTPDKGSGDFFLANCSMAFQVPYGAIVPKRVEGLLVPVAMSATHVAFSAVRMDPTWMAMGQAAGIAAAISVRDKVDVRKVSLDRLQRELVRQKCRLLFYWDVPIEHPAFAAIQWLSAKQVVRGNPGRLFRPDGPLTRAELAALIVKWQGLWPSVSNVHFADVPYSHWAFRDVETLFDHRLLSPFGVTALWHDVKAYDARQHAGFGQSGNLLKFKPESPVEWHQFVATVRMAQGLGATAAGDRVGKAPALPGEDGMAEWLKKVRASEFARLLEVRPDVPIRRGEAAMVVAALATSR